MVKASIGSGQRGLVSFVVSGRVPRDDREARHFGALFSSGFCARADHRRSASADARRRSRGGDRTIRRLFFTLVSRSVGSVGAGPAGGGLVGGVGSVLLGLGTLGLALGALASAGFDRHSACVALAGNLLESGSAADSGRFARSAAGGLVARRGPLGTSALLSSGLGWPLGFARTNGLEGASWNGVGVVSVGHASGGPARALGCPGDGTAQPADDSGRRLPAFSFGASGRGVSQPNRASGSVSCCRPGSAGSDKAISAGSGGRVAGFSRTVCGDASGSAVDSNRSVAPIGRVSAGVGGIDRAGPAVQGPWSGLAC